MSSLKVLSVKQFSVKEVFGKMDLTMSPGNIFYGQMSLWQLSAEWDGPLNLPLKIGVYPICNRCNSVIPKLT